MTGRRETLARRWGRLVWSSARLSRRVFGPRNLPADAPVAVMCDTFVRYGMAQAAGLKAAGSPVVCCWVDRLTDFGDDESERQIFLDWAEAAGVELVKLPRRSMPRFFSQTLAVHRELRRRGVRALVVHPHIDPRYATLGLAFPVVFVLHDPSPHTGDYDSHFPGVIRAITRFAELTSAALMLHSERLLPQLSPSLSSHPLTVVPHGAKMAAAPSPLPTEPTALLVGRLMAYKGIDTALAATPALRAAVPNATVVIAGQGRMADAVKNASTDGVVLRDEYIPEAELERLLDEASIVVLPYRDATQSGVGLLAVARGIPCVVTKVGALPDLVPPSRPHWAVPVADADALAAAMIEAFDHGAELRAEVYEHARQEFAWAAVGRRLLDDLPRLST